MPSEAALTGFLDELSRTLDNLPAIHERLMSLTGEAWSDDRLVRVEVGPRGQLVDLEIDPRVFRKPDSYGLRASILAAASAAVRDVTGQAQQIVADQLASGAATPRAHGTSGGTGSLAGVLRTDAEVLAEGSGTDAGLRRR